MKQSFLKTVLLIFITFGINTLYAQNIKKGSLIIEPYLGGPNFGFILGKAVQNEIDNRTNTGHFSTDSGIGPNGIRGEYLVTNRISIGFDYIFNEVNGSGHVDTTLNNSIEVNYTIDVKSTRHRFLLKANYHFITKDYINFYGGVGIGYNQRHVIINTNIPYFENQNVRGSIWPVAARMELGLTYYPIKPIGINIELGLGGPLISAGIVFKLNTIRD